MVVLWIPKSLTSLANFSFSLNLLKICPWWNAAFIIPSFFLLIISLYCLIIYAAFSGSCISSASLFKLSNFATSSMIMDPFLSLLLINVLPFCYLPHLSTSINKKIITIVPTLKQKCVSKLSSFCKFRSKKITAVIFSFSHSSFKVLSLN